MLLTCAEFYVAFLGILMVNCKQNIAKKDAVHHFVAEFASSISSLLKMKAMFLRRNCFIPVQVVFTNWLNWQNFILL